VTLVYTDHIYRFECFENNYTKISLGPLILALREAQICFRESSLNYSWNKAGIDNMCCQ